jgi:LPXTG-motif cell wall-anchored protein
MKKMKKILAVVLAMAMVLGMSVTAFAEPGGESGDTSGAAASKIEGKSSDKGTITVKGFDFGADAESTPDGFKVTAYPIIKAMYENGQTFEERDGVSVGKNDGTFSSYKAIYGKDEVGDEAISTEAVQGKGDPLPKINIDQSQLTAIWNYISGNNADESKVEIDGHAMVLAKAQGEDTFTATATDLPIGSYLVVVTGSDSKIYNPIVASLYYEVKDDENTVEGGEVNLAVKATDSWVKVINAPIVDKSIVTTTTEQGSTTITNDNHSTANIGDEIEYQIVIDPVPAYGGSYPVLNAVDTLSKGLELVTPETGSPFTVKVYEANADLTNAGVKAKGVILNGGAIDKNGAITGENVQYGYKSVKDTSTGTTTITIDFVSTEDGESEYLLTGYEGKKVVISYKAKLTNDAVLNQNANENDVMLNYTKDSKVTGDEVKDTTEDKTYTYTFDIDGGVSGTDTEINATITNFNKEILTKTGEKRVVPVLGADGNPLTDEVTGEVITKEVYTLPDAEFTLYIDKECTQPYTNASIVGKEDGNAITFTGVIKSTDDGRLPVKGLKAGTYYLKETKAPDGYSLNTHVFKIVIAAQYHESDVKDKDGNVEFKAGELKSWTITVDGDDATNKSENTFTVKHDGVTNKNVVEVNVTVEGEESDLNTTEIKNTKLSGLPSTGGIGTTIFTIGGCAIMIVAAGLFFASRRKSSK